MLTFRGGRWVARTSESLLRAGGMGQFVAADEESHVRQAVELASSPQARGMLDELRMTQRQRLLASPVCDVGGLARELEPLYERMAQGR